jgi:succinate dehydrogenase/fumarate reductase flavoprotein subunit
MIEMHISEIGFCSGHSASGIWINEKGEASIPGLYAAGDCASVPHNYMLGAFVYGKFCGENAADYCAGVNQSAVDDGFVEKETARIAAPLAITEGLTPFQVEYKTRRMVNDYLQPPKVTRKMEIGLQRFDEIREDLKHMSAADPHELMRAMEAHTIRDCAELAARASLFRTESRWGLYHLCVDHPERDDENWNCHTNVGRDANGKMTFRKREIEPYIIELDEQEKSAYQRLRVARPPQAA